MSSKIFSGAAEIATGANTARGILSTIALVLAAVNEAREAQGCYRSLTRHGASPEDASAETVRRHYKS